MNYQSPKYYYSLNSWWLFYYQTNQLNSGFFAWLGYYLLHDFTWFIPFLLSKDWGQSQWGISQSFHMAIFWLQKTLILLCQTMMDWPVWIYTSHIHKSLVHTCLDMMMASISTTQQTNELRCCSVSVAQSPWKFESI